MIEASNVLIGILRIFSSHKSYNQEYSSYIKDLNHHQTVKKIIALSQVIFFCDCSFKNFSENEVCDDYKNWKANF